MPEWIDSPGEAVTIITLLASVCAALFFIIDSRVRRTYMELKPNHGSSLRDAVDRIEQKIDAHIRWHLDRSEP